MSVGQLCRSYTVATTDYKNPCRPWPTRVCCHTLTKPDCLAPLRTLHHEIDGDVSDTYDDVEFQPMNAIGVHQPRHDSDHESVETETSSIDQESQEQPHEYEAAGFSPVISYHPAAQEQDEETEPSGISPMTLHESDPLLD